MSRSGTGFRIRSCAKKADDRKDARTRLFGNAYLLLALASLCWSGNHLMGRAIAGHVPPLTISTLRWLLAAAVLYPFVHEHLKRDWPLIRAHVGVLAYLSLLGGGLFGALQFVGLQLTTALNVSVMNSLGAGVHRARPAP